VTRAAVLLALFLALPSTAAAQDPPACPPDKVFDVVLTSQERGEDAPIVATHEVAVTADIRGDARAITVTPQAGVAVLNKNSSGTIIIFAPTTPTLTVTASWRQSVDPANSDETGRCSASRDASLPVLAANPARGVPQLVRGAPRVSEFVSFAVAPALKRPNLSPLEVSIRSTGHVRYPRRNERLVAWSVPMRTGDQLKYRGHLPNLAYATFKQKCRYWWFECGPVNSQVAALSTNDRGRPDLDGDNAILMVLAHSQPARWAAENGIVVDAFPGAARNRPFGYDVQVKQSGRLLARVRRAGRCVDTPLNGGIRHRCKVARASTLLR
jgi:hypothetical protein